MKKLLVALLALLALAVSPPAQAASNADVTALARWAGCRAQVITDDTESPIASFFVAVDGGLLAIGTGPGGPPAGLEMMIWLHEIGHCLQYQEHGERLFDASLVDIELDADRRGADLACALGRDGRRMLRDLFEWAAETLGYNGDENHGTSAERIAQGARASVCMRRQQS